MASGSVVVEIIHNSLQYGCLFVQPLIYFAKKETINMHFNLKIRVVCGDFIAFIYFFFFFFQPNLNSLKTEFKTILICVRR